VTDSFPAQYPRTLLVLDLPSRTPNRQTVPRPISFASAIAGACAACLCPRHGELPSMAHVVVCASSMQCQDRGIDAAAAKQCRASLTLPQPRACSRHHAVDWRALAFEGAEIRAAKAPSTSIACWQGGGCSRGVAADQSRGREDAAEHVGWNVSNRAGGRVMDHGPRPRSIAKTPIIHPRLAKLAFDAITAAALLISFAGRFRWWEADFVLRPDIPV